MKIYTHLQKSVSHAYTAASAYLTGSYSREVAAGLILVVGAAIGYFGYGFYVDKREQAAFKALAEVSDSFMKTQYSLLHVQKDEEVQTPEKAWQETELLLDTLYAQNKRSYLAPYFLLYKSQIALEKGESVDQALTIMQEALRHIAKSSPFFALYNLKRILMSFNSADETVRKNALHDLIATVQDEKGYAFDEASYLLGIYYISQVNMAQAKEVFERMLKHADKKSLVPSPWVKQVEEKLASIQ